MTQTELLKNKDVLKEIERHKWLESEKAGHDIGFEKASRDWVNRYSREWMRQHRPQKSLTMATILEKARQLNHFQFDLLFKRS